MARRMTNTARAMRGAVAVRRKPVLEIPPASYQPTKAELEADASIDATPDELARALMRDVTIVTREP